MNNSVIQTCTIVLVVNFKALNEYIQVYTYRVSYINKRETDERYIRNSTKDIGPETIS